MGHHRAVIAIHSDVEGRQSEEGRGVELGVHK